jgi:hypothetical protein
MMNHQQYLLTKLAEECNELAKQCMKQNQFGRNEKHEILGIRNCDLTRDEALDVSAMIQICMTNGAMPLICQQDIDARVILRRRKIRRYKAYSRKLGMVK